MIQTSLKCYQVELLKEFLNKFHPLIARKPNGQTMYKFPDKLVINLYETGACVFQGNIDSFLLKGIKEHISSLNSIH